MHLKIKDLKQNEFKISVKPSDTILKVKQKIKLNCAEKYDPKEQKLVYLGVMLSDDCTVAECEFDDSDHVLLIYRPAVQSVNAAKNDSEVDSAADSDSTEEVLSSSNYKNSKEKEEYDVKTVNELVSMGYTKKMVKKALRASFNNVEVAVEYLVNGIPDEIGRQLHNTSETDFDETSHNNPLATVIPNFNALCSAIRNDPGDLSKMFSDISLQDHLVYRKILDNQHAFIDAVEVDAADDQNKCIILGPEDNEAIGRLESIGFDSDFVIQAYRACDLNETATAEFLSALKG